METGAFFSSVSMSADSISSANTSSTFLGGCGDATTMVTGVVVVRWVGVVDVVDAAADAGLNLFKGFVGKRPNVPAFISNIARSRDVSGLVGSCGGSFSIGGGRRGGIGGSSTGIGFI